MRYGRALSLHQFLAPHVLIFRVSRGNIVVAESLRQVHFSHALGITLNKYVPAPLGINRWALSSTAEELLVLNLQRANVVLDLCEIVVDCGHGLIGSHFRLRAPAHTVNPPGRRK